MVSEAGKKRSKENYRINFCLILCRNVKFSRLIDLDYYSKDSKLMLKSIETKERESRSTYIIVILKQENTGNSKCNKDSECSKYNLAIYSI